MKLRKKMKGPKVMLTAMLLAVLLVPALGTAQDVSLKGNVFYLDEQGVPLVQKMGLAANKFKKEQKGEVYFTGYIFQSRYEIHMNGDYDLEKPYEISSRGDEIRIRRNSDRDGFNMESNEAIGCGEIAGLLIMHKISDRKSGIMDIHIFDLARAYEFNQEPLYWLGSMQTEESFCFLEDEFKNADSDLKKTITFMIYSHDTPSSYDFLFKAGSGSYSHEVKRNAIFWLGNFKDPKSLALLQKIFQKEDSIEVKKGIVFAINLSDMEEALEELIRIAKRDSSQEVRKQAVFWLGQKASQKSIEALKGVAEEENEDTEVRKSAVFAISQLPSEKAVPILIDIARTNKSPSIKKQAIFWLGQKDSEEALKFFEEILLKK
jgi:hypothetical protein